MAKCTAFGSKTLPQRPIVPSKDHRTLSGSVERSRYHEKCQDVSSLLSMFEHFGTHWLLGLLDCSKLLSPAIPAAAWDYRCTGSARCSTCSRPVAFWCLHSTKPPGKIYNDVQIDWYIDLYIDIRCQGLQHCITLHKSSYFKFSASQESFLWAFSSISSFPVWKKTRKLQRLASLHHYAQRALDIL